MKLFILLLTIVFFLAGCNIKTPEQKAQEKFEMQKVQREKDALKFEVYADSLVRVATGLEGVTKPLNRKNALKILRKEFPTMKDYWDKCEESINNMEVYSE